MPININLGGAVDTYRTGKARDEMMRLQNQFFNRNTQSDIPRAKLPEGTPGAPEMPPTLTPRDTSGFAQELSNLLVRYGDIPEVKEFEKRIINLQAQEGVDKYKQADTRMRMAEQQGPDAWMTAPKDELQKISEGQVLNEMYGSDKYGLAGEFGLTSNTSDKAKEFMSNLRTQDSRETQKINPRDKQFRLRWTKDNPEEIQKTKDSIDALVQGELMRPEIGEALKTEADFDTPSVRDAIRSLLSTPEKKYQTLSQTGDLEAQVGAKKKSAGIQAEYSTKAGIPGSFKGSQYLAGNYAKRLEQAEMALNELQGAGFDPSTMYNQIAKSDALTAIKDPQQRKYAQALRNFINATLRRESGAAIADHEFDSAIKQYFPQFNDDPETQEQKRQNRLDVLSSFRAEAGGAFDQIKGERAKVDREMSRTGNRDIPSISTEEEYNNLEPGQQYYDPNGVLRRKK